MYYYLIPKYDDWLVHIFSLFIKKQKPFEAMSNILLTNSPTMIAHWIPVKCPSRQLCWRVIMKCCAWTSGPGAAAPPQEPNQTHLQSGRPVPEPWTATSPVRSQLVRRHDVWTQLPQREWKEILAEYNWVLFTLYICHIYTDWDHLTHFPVLSIYIYTNPLRWQKQACRNTGARIARGEVNHVHW